jgi:hypothetical protein
MHHYFMATGVHGKSVSGEFKEHADAEHSTTGRQARLQSPQSAGAFRLAIY